MNGRILATVCGLAAGAIGSSLGTAYGQAAEAHQVYHGGYGPWSPPAYRYALPYIYAYAPPHAARRVHAALDAYVPPLPVYAPWPRVYGYPYGPGMPQPIVPERTWTGPNGFGYGPQYAAPAVQGVRPPAVPQTPTPANPATRPQAVGPSGAVAPGGAAATSPPPPKSGPPEVIPVPPSEPGPREF